MKNKRPNGIPSLESLLDLDTIEDAAEAHSRGITVAGRYHSPTQALGLFAWAHSSEPNHLLYAADYALALYESGRETEARQVALVVDARTQHMPEDDFNGRELCRIGLALSIILNAEYRALAFLETACKKEPTDTELLLNYGISLKTCGYEDDAVVVGEKVISALEHQTAMTAEQAATLAKGASLLRHSEPVKAWSAVQKALRIAPEVMGVQHAAGSIAMENNDHQGAAIHYQKAIQIEPLNPRPRVCLQCALFGMGLFEDALALGEDLLKRWPQIFEVQFNNASAALNMGWHKEAEQGFLDILSKNRDDAVVHAALGLCYALQGLESEARDRQSEALAIGGDDPEVQRISSLIDRILDSGGAPSDEEITSLFLAVFAAISRKQRPL